MSIEAGVMEFMMQLFMVFIYINLSKDMLPLESSFFQKKKSN